MDVPAVGVDTPITIGTFFAHEGSSDIGKAYAKPNPTHQPTNPSLAMFKQPSLSAGFRATRDLTTTVQPNADVLVPLPQFGDVDGMFHPNDLNASWKTTKPPTLGIIGLPILLAGAVLFTSGCSDQTSETQPQPPKTEAVKTQVSAKGVMAFPNFGFSIETNGFTAVYDDMTEHGMDMLNMIMTLQVPPAGEVAPVVTVTVVADTFPPDISMKDMVPTIKVALQETGQWHRFTSERSDVTSATFDYTLLLNNKKARAYSKVVRGNQKLYILNAFAAEIQWDTVSKRLKSAVNSFSTTGITPKTTVAPIVFKTNARAIWSLINDANVEREELDLPSLWPGDLINEGKVFKSAEDYFTYLMSDGDSPVIAEAGKRLVGNLTPEMLVVGDMTPAKVGGKVTPEANVWHVVVVSNYADADHPFLFSRNVKASDLRYATKEELDTHPAALPVMGFNAESLPQAAYGVWICRGGAVSDAKPDRLTFVHICPVSQPRGKPPLSVLPAQAGHH